MVNYVNWPKGRHSKTRFFQNWILRNTRNCRISDLRKTLVGESRKTWVLQKRNRAILREMTFANDCTNCCFFAQNWCAKKEKNCVSFRKNCGKVLRMEILDKIYLCFFVKVGWIKLSVQSANIFLNFSF